MLKLLIIKEIKEIIGSSKFVLSFGVLSILILATFYIGAKNYQISKAQYDAAVAENIKSMEGVTDWRMVNHQIFLPPMPIASLVSGLSNDIGRNIEMKGRGELIAKESKYNEDPVYAAFRFLDLNFLFQIILSLFAILFTYNAVSGEKENGTLRLIFSNAVPRDKFILGKIIGSFVSLTIPILIPFLIGFLILNLLQIPMNTEDWLKLILISLTGFLLLGVYLVISVFISSITKSSSHSFLYLLMVWTFAVLIIPRSSVLIAGRAVNVPNIDEINSKKNENNRQLMDEHFKALGGFKPDPSIDPQNMMTEFNKFMEKLNEEKADKMNSFSEKLNRERNNYQRIQENLALNIAKVSPSALFEMAATNLAGTSMKLIREYQNQADTYQNTFADFQKEKTGATTGGGFAFFVRRTGEEVPVIDPSELPQFQFSQITFAEAFDNALIDVALLILLILLFFSASFVSFLKYDLR